MISRLRSWWFSCKAQTRRSARRQAVARHVQRRGTQIRARRGPAFAGGRLRFDLPEHMRSSFAVISGEREQSRPWRSAANLGLGGQFAHQGDQLILNFQQPVAAQRDAGRRRGPSRARRSIHPPPRRLRPAGDIWRPAGCTSIRCCRCLPFW